MYKLYVPYEAMANEFITSQIEGAQNVRGIWRLYTNNREARTKLLISGLSLRGRTITLYEKNPHTTNIHDPAVQAEKITIKDLPFSVDNEEIENYLKEKGVKLSSDIKYGRERNDKGKLTSFRNGDRFTYAISVFPIIPFQSRITSFPCRVIHQSQKEVCKPCDRLGHSLGDLQCPAYKPAQNVTVFQSHTNPLSNFDDVYQL